MVFLKGKEPTDGELNFLLELPLFQVCIGANEVIFNFDDNVSITVESTITIRDASGHKTTHSHLPSAALGLSKLLCSKVVELVLERTGTLSLQFGTGDTLSFHKASDPYESYQIKRPGAVYVV